MRFSTEIICDDGTTFTDGTSTSLEYELRRRNEIVNADNEYWARVVSDDLRNKVFTKADIDSGEYR